MSIQFRGLVPAAKLNLPVFSISRRNHCYSQIMKIVFCWRKYSELIKIENRITGGPAQTESTFHGAPCDLSALLLGVFLLDCPVLHRSQTLWSSFHDTMCYLGHPPCPRERVATVESRYFGRPQRY